MALTAMIMGVSDNAYLALFALLGLLPLYLFADRKGIQSYSAIISTFVTIIFAIDKIEAAFGDRVQEISGIFNFFTRIPGMWAIVLILWGITAGFYLYNCKAERKGREIKATNLYRYIWLAVVICAAAVILFVLYDANIAGNGERYGAVANYVILTMSGEQDEGMYGN